MKNLIPKIWRPSRALIAAKICLFFSSPLWASIEGTLSNTHTRLIQSIVPLVAILGLVFAGLSFVMGNPNARSHLLMAIVGAVICFGAPSIVTFIQGLVN